MAAGMGSSCASRGPYTTPWKRFCELIMHQFVNAACGYICVPTMKSVVAYV